MGGMFCNHGLTLPSSSLYQLISKWYKPLCSFNAVLFSPVDTNISFLTPLEFAEFYCSILLLCMAICVHIANCYQLQIILSSLKLKLKTSNSLQGGKTPPVMSDVPSMASMNPEPLTVTPDPSLMPRLTSGLPTTTLLPWEEQNMQVHTVLIIIIFCVVCFLLLVAFFYAFCIRCSVGPSQKGSQMARGCSLEREDATFRRSSSDGQSVGNVV